MFVEIWHLAMRPGVIPLTLMLIPMGIFWVSCLLGSLDFDFLSFDGGEGGFDSGDGGEWLGGTVRYLFRYFHGDQVPVAALLSFLLVYEWGAVMVVHSLKEEVPGAADSWWIALACLVPALALTKLTSRLLSPMFANLRGAEGLAAPVIGRIGFVRSRECDEHSGQVEVQNSEAPLLINARLAPGQLSLPRGTRVVVRDHDPVRGTYLVQPDPENP
ncbi:hypothetical protein [Haloferula luteola]|nr:hypothetical protein [Haloferula luteola]